MNLLNLINPWLDINYQITTKFATTFSPTKHLLSFRCSYNSLTLVTSHGDDRQWKSNLQFNWKVVQLPLYHSPVLIIYRSSCCCQTARRASMKHLSDIGSFPRPTRPWADGKHDKVLYLQSAHQQLNPSHAKKNEMKHCSAVQIPSQRRTLQPLPALFSIWQLPLSAHYARSSTRSASSRRPGRANAMPRARPAARSTPRKAARAAVAASCRWPQ